MGGSSWQDGSCATQTASCPLLRATLVAGGKAKTNPEQGKAVRDLTRPLPQKNFKFAALKMKNF